MAENAQPIIIKKKKRAGHGGAHGGSWKVAYADFVTAMMAFFLLLWLLNVSNEEVLQGISNYFKNPQIVNAAGGASTSVIKLGKHVDVSKGEGEQGQVSDLNEQGMPSFEEVEKRKFEQLKEEIEYQIDNTPSLAAFKDQLLLDITSEGLRIQLVDKENRPMFDLGSANLKPYARKILRKIATLLQEVKNNISISGHTDARGYVSEQGYGNWELSAERANAARRELIDARVDQKQISRVVGLASRVLYNNDDPYDPVNRRISIVLMNKKTNDALIDGESAGSIPQAGVIELPKPLQDAVKSGLIQRSGEIIRE